MLRQVGEKSAGLDCEALESAPLSTKVVAYLGYVPIVKTLDLNALLQATRVQLATASYRSSNDVVYN